MANFFAVTLLEFLADGKKHEFSEVVEAVSRQMDENITKEKLKEMVFKNRPALHEMGGAECDFPQKRQGLYDDTLQYRPDQSGERV